MFENDEEGKKFFANYLISNGFHDVTTTLPFTEWDLEATKDDIVYYFELKVRPKPAIDGKWNDSICEQNKLDTVPDLHHAYLVNFFTDCFTVIPMKAEHTVQHKPCQKTNNWNRKKVMKDLLSYPNLEKYKHKYEVTNFL